MNESIKENISRLRSEIPDEVEIEAACKTRTPEEIQAAVDGGIRILGQNYVQEAEEAHPKVKGDIKWHMIGHLQRNKVKRAVKIFDLIESLDSYRLAKEINKRCAKINKVADCLVEVNSGREEKKYGIFPEDVEDFIEKVSSLKNVRIKGLMTMGPFMGREEDFRPCFKTTKKIYDHIKSKKIPNCEMKYLSMGMSASYNTAIQEGANLVRIGTKIFGPR